MVIDQTQWTSPPKRIGNVVDGDEIFEVVTKGGLVMVSSKGKGEKMTVLGVGPHRAVARYVAMQKMGDKMRITELSKSEGHIVRGCPQLSEYVALVDRLNGI